MRLHLPTFSRAKRPQTRRGWTLLETVISVSLGTTILGTMLPTGLAVSNSMVAIGNYCDLNRASCTTLDTMSRDLRNTAVVLAINNNRVTVSNIMTGALITYSWDGSNRFTRTFNGTSTVMLTSCDYLSFNGYQRNPTNNFQFLTAPTPEQTKLISVSWRCARKILGAKVNTESVQTAQICIRN